VALLPHHLLRPFGVVPEARLDLGRFDLGQALELLGEVKDSP
jgi:hypothetical protein